MILTLSQYREWLYENIDWLAAGWRLVVARVELENALRIGRGRNQSIAFSCTKR